MIYLALLLAGLARFAMAMEAGLARVDITPRHPVPLAWRTNPPTAKVYHPLYAKALAVTDGQTRVVLVTADIGYFCRDISEQIHVRIRRLGLRPHQVLLNASHNHSAPALCPLDDVVEPGQLDYRYQQFVIERVVSAIESALATRKPALVATAEGTCDVCINRRLGTEMAPNPEGAYDPRVRLLTVRDAADRKLRGVLFLFACHPSDVENGSIGADFFGFAQTELEAKQPGVIAMSAQGAGGNIRVHHVDEHGRKFSWSRGDNLAFNREAGRKLAAAALSGLGAGEKPVEGAIGSNLLEIQIPLGDPVTLGEARRAAAGKDPWKARWGKRLMDLSERQAELPKRMPFWIQAITIGRDFAAVGLDGEVFVEYALEIERALASSRAYVFGYSNASLAYIPTAKAVAEGGYEVDVFYWWVLPSRISPRAERVIVDAAVTLVKELRSEADRIRL
ncbi:MAG: neutral/alkaline non-lysosomal ceramidase N-terminal domain-containing protein [Bryobacteraceae bacterium]